MTQPTDQQWRDQALCAETDPDAFFPEPGTIPHAALRVCAACLVRDACLTDALDRRDVLHGVLGGTTPTERRRLLRQRNTAVRTGRAA